MTTIHHTPPPGATPFAIYEDPEDQEPPSPSEMFESDVSFNSELSLPGPDEAITSIELGHDHNEEPEPYKSSYTSRPSNISSSALRRISGVTSTSFISSIPSEVSIASKPVVPANYGDDSRYSPRKERPPFRNPSSVRAMQMSSPPPLPAYEASRERAKGSYKLATPSKSGGSETSGTRSRRSGSHRGSFHKETHAHPSPQQTPQQHLPLVLLHVTILPMQVPYSHDLMVKIMPHWLVENYRLLEEKLQDIILMRRGLLIPHPNDEYELLEERILESLELKTPRLLKCGHFVGPEDDDDSQGDDSEDDEQRSTTDDGTGRGSRMSGGTITVEDDCEWKHTSLEATSEGVCTDCHRQLKKPRAGVGSGKKRWDLKIYAANGLMRAGAWGAAWSEMERCDVEISPWIPDDVRKALDKRVEEEQEAEQRKQIYAAEVQRRVEEDAAKQRQLEIEAEAKRKIEEEEMQRKIEAEAALLQKKVEEEVAEKIRQETILNEKIEAAKEAIRMEFEAQSLAESHSVTERLKAMEETLREQQKKAARQLSPVRSLSPARSRGRSQSASRQVPVTEVPLDRLLKNYFLLQLRDQRNFVILLLGTLVVYMSMNMDPKWKQELLSAGPFNQSPADTLAAQEVSSVIVTTTATSIATVTVTQVEVPDSTSTEVARPSIVTSKEVVLDEASSSISPTSSSLAIMEEVLALSMSTSAAIAIESEEVAGPSNMDEAAEANDPSVGLDAKRNDEVSEATESIVEGVALLGSSSVNQELPLASDTETKQPELVMALEKSSDSPIATVPLLPEVVIAQPALQEEVLKTEETLQGPQLDHKKDEL